MTLKKMISLPVFSVFTLFLAVLQVGNTSCNKDVDPITITDTVTVIQKDTVAIKDTLITPAILTANPWKIEYARAIYGSGYIFYTRGETTNTQDFDNEYITFNTNGTGIYHDNAGGETTLTWRFTDSSYTKLTWTWNMPQPVVVTWENIVYKDAAVHYTEYYTQFGNNVLGSVIRIPK